MSLAWHVCPGPHAQMPTARLGHAFSQVRVLLQGEVQKQSLSPLLESEMLPFSVLALETRGSVLTRST